MKGTEMGREMVKSLSLVRPSATPWTAAYQAPPSMGFSRQGYWSGVPFPSPGDLLNQEIKEPVSPALQADSLPVSLEGTTEVPGTTSSEPLLYSDPHSLLSWCSGEGLVPGTWGGGDK